mgnify:CR=1 FL=1
MRALAGRLPAVSSAVTELQLADELERGAVQGELSLLLALRPPSTEESLLEVASELLSQLAKLPGAPFELELAAEEYRQVLATNLEGYFLCAKAFGRHLVAQGHGKVINISSIMGRVALANQAAYASSKGAIEQLTKVLAIEWAPQNVQVNAIGPTYFETDLTRPLFEDEERHDFITGRTPMGRWGQPHELAGAVIFLASDASNYVTGHTLMVDGGWTAW